MSPLPPERKPQDTIAMHDAPYRPILPLPPVPPRTGPAPAPLAGVKKRRSGLHVRFVTRMSGELSAAIGRAARRDGLTGGAWVRRLLLERLDLQSADDARSGRPVRIPEAHQAAVAAALRELAEAGSAVRARDEAEAAHRLQAARTHLIPLALGQAEP